MDAENTPPDTPPNEPPATVPPYTISVSGWDEDTARRLGGALPGEKTAVNDTAQREPSSLWRRSLSSIEAFLARIIRPAQPDAPATEPAAAQLR